MRYILVFSCFLMSNSLADRYPQNLEPFKEVCFTASVSKDNIYVDDELAVVEMQRLARVYRLPYAVDNCFTNYTTTLTIFLEISGFKAGTYYVYNHGVKGIATSTRISKVDINSRSFAGVVLYDHAFFGVTPVSQIGKDTYFKDIRELMELLVEDWNKAHP